MTRDDVIKMASEAGIEWQEITSISGSVRVTTLGSQVLEKIECFAALVAAVEREECAKVCENPNSIKVGNIIAPRFAVAIRARGTHD